MKKVFITGATGFVGANLTRRLIKDRCEVHLLVRPQHKAWRIQEIRDQIVCHEGSIADKNFIHETLQDVRPNWIFHLAAYGAYSQQTDWEQMVKTNIHGIHHLTEAALKVGFESFINVGSSSEYGFKDHAPLENEPLEPNSPYALTKSYATMLCRHLAVSQKVNMMTLRPYSVFGPFEEPTRLIPKLIVMGLDGQLPPLVSPVVARDYIYVDDFVDACILTAQKPDHTLDSIYNVGTGIQTTLQEVVDVARRLLPIKEESQWGSMPNRVWDTNVWVSNPSRIQKALGWKAQKTFEEGFRKTIQWFKQNPSQHHYYRSCLEQTAIS